MPLCLIAAVSKNGCIGKDGRLPWHLPEDLARFKQLTLGKIVVMGRKTWESLPSDVQPLPGRTNIVITRQTDYHLPDGVLCYASLNEAIHAHREQDICIIGGGQIYQEAIELVDTLYITEVDQTVLGDTYFPTIDPETWHLVGKDQHSGFTFVTYRHNLSP
ncbi:dihydrofolate reductase [Patescibacteria group bacterium]|nr:dihydrofolate reductase [Patescibacteria group bacterium]